jgi:hypothetical protein
MEFRRIDRMRFVLICAPTPSLSFSLSLALLSPSLLSVFVCGAVDFNILFKFVCRNMEIGETIEFFNNGMYDTLNIDF